MKTLNEFYPTPKELIVKMLAGSEFNADMSILEPSAGKGHIMDHIKGCLDAWGSYYKEDKGYDIDAIEVNPEFVHILRGKGHRVVHDDFLTYETQKRYDLIIMNPPFSESDKHLLKALGLVKDGGKVICLLNAETLKNQYSNYRATLVRRLEELDADIEYITSAFADAERKTDVEIALIKVSVPGEYDSIILDGLKKSRTNYGEFHQSNDLVQGDALQGIADMYSFDAEAVAQLINEYYSIELRLGDTVFKLVHEEKDFYSNINRYDFINSAIRKLRHDYWKRFFNTDKISKLLTVNLRQKFYNKLNELKDYDLTIHNMYAMMDEIMKSMTQGVEDCITSLFDELSSRHSYNEYSKNIHYFDGWKTNKAWYINKKVILPLSVFDEWRGTYEFYPGKAEGKLSDIEKAFNYLDVGRTESIDIRETLIKARKQGQTQKIPFKFFTATFYKKGTTHIEFTDMELLKKFNIFGSQQKKWLPPGYGNVPYEDMSEQEQKVVDSFEGKDEYQKVCAKPDYYIFSAAQIQLLTGSVAVGYGETDKLIGVCEGNEFIQ